MSRPAPMTADLTRPATEFVVTVTHGIAQSYSRAVQPFAMRKAREFGVALMLDHVDYDVPTPPDLPAARCRTAYHFTRS